MQRSSHFPAWSRFAIPVVVALLISFQDILENDFSAGEMLLVVIGYVLFGLLIGVFYARTSPTDQPYGKLGAITAMGIWSVFFIGVGVISVIRNRVESGDLFYLLILLTLGQLFPALVGYGYSVLMRAVDPHGLVRTRASVIRFVTLFSLLLLATAAISLSIVLLDIARWLQPYLLLVGFSVWLGIAWVWK
jgi:hypothetical protein